MLEILDDPKAVLLTYIRIYGDISLIVVDTNDSKITWYNKQLYLVTKKAIVFLDDKYLLYLNDLIIYTYKDLDSTVAMQLLQHMLDMLLFEHLTEKYSVLAALCALSPSGKTGMVLQKNIKKANVVDFHEYLAKYYEKISYVIC